jgi:hypothetical protein
MGVTRPVAQCEAVQESTMKTPIERHVQQRNQESLDDFHGLSPEQMYRMLHFPFVSPALVRFPEVQDASPTTPIMSLVGQLIDAIGESGLKPTAKGNLPQKFCRDAALAYWGEEVYRENTRYGGINREEDFIDLHVTRLVAELAGLIRKYKRKFILSRNCRTLLAQQCSAALHPQMFRAYTERFNWAYWDRYPDLRFIQTAFLFTLYLLTRYGAPMSFTKIVFCVRSPCCWMKYRPIRSLAPRSNYAPALPRARLYDLLVFLV